MHLSFKTIEWKNNQVWLIDQTRLPSEEIYLCYKDHLSLADAISTMVVRGAPAIGVAAAMGVALGALEFEGDDLDAFYSWMDRVCHTLVKTRPTAVNLSWAISRMQRAYQNQKSSSVSSLKKQLIELACAIGDEDAALCFAIGKHGASLIEDHDTILTHCNAGALATAGQGTALGVIYEAKRQNKNISVFADETRPFLQGARLTAWELNKNKIPVTLIADNAAASFMRQGLIQKIIVGADRIAFNGDVANKIGTYPVAISAKEHRIPFYVAAPFSTFDPLIKTGREIVIEERSANEITYFGKQEIAPKGIQVRNPAFDVTEAKWITAIITEKGIVYPPFDLNLNALYRSNDSIGATLD